MTEYINVKSLVHRWELWEKKTMIETVIGCCVDWDCDWVYLLKSDGSGGGVCSCVSGWFYLSH